MLSRYYKPHKADFCCGSARYNKRSDFTYASCLNYSRNNGITVKMASAKASDIDTPCSYVEKGLLRYKKRWERREVDICVNKRMLTGIPIFTGSNTLRVVDGDYSYFIPLEKVVFILIRD